MASAVLSTLHHVTEKKLEKLEEHRQRFEVQRGAILQAAKSAPTLGEQVKALLEGCEKNSITISRTGISLKNVSRFLDQSKHDPSVSPELLKQWKQKIEHDLDLQGVKYEYASLFGRLVTEWTENPNDAAASHKRKRSDSDSSDSTVSFEQVGREEMHEQRKEWESYAFNPKPVHEAEIQKYLEALFGTTHKSKKLKRTPLEEIRYGLGDIENVHPVRFDANTVSTCIEGVIRSDLFAGPKREALLDLRNRNDILSEMADVLNMDLDSLEEWEWNPQPVQLHMRRQLSGKYRVFMDEDLHQAILLQFIGTKFTIRLKEIFSAFFHSGAWLNDPFHASGKRDRERREFFLGNAAGLRNKKTVRNARRTEFQNDYFMTQLSNTFQGAGRDYGDDEDEDVYDPDERKTPMATKQGMLRLATTELLINTRLYGEFTILQSDFKWFGPSLPHQTIFTVLKFLGVKDKWLSFIRKFLETPLAFAQDGEDGSVRKRRRGIPMSHVLSDTLGEAVLFCLDFAVNQRTKGGNIYRFHDDLWFWGQESACVDAWKAMVEFSKVMGLELNEEKTGTVQVSIRNSGKKLSSALPVGPVRWGFLKLDAESGRWLIDQTEVEQHIAELKRQLAACRSVFAWVQAYNSYVDRFFSTNFGQPAQCFGKEHVQMQIETFEHIQRKLFGGDKGGDANVTDYLREVIKERFGVTDLPDGFFYLPIELGGLELRSPFIPLFMRVRQSIAPRSRIDRAFEKEEEEYDRLRGKYESGEYNPHLTSKAYIPHVDEPFMSLEEFTSFMEETSRHLHDTYEELMQQSPQDSVEFTKDVGSALQTLPSVITFEGDFTRSWNTMKPYWKWVLELYAADMLKRFGGLAMGEQGLLPIKLVSTLRSEKVRWQS